MSVTEIASKCLDDLIDSIAVNNDSFLNNNPIVYDIFSRVEQKLTNPNLGFTLLYLFSQSTLSQHM